MLATCCGRVGKKDAIDQMSTWNPDNKGLELLPNTDWDGYAAFDMTPERGGNAGTWRFSYYEFPVGSRSTEVGDIGRTATFDIRSGGGDVSSTCYSGLTRQTTSSSSTIRLRIVMRAILEPGPLWR